MPMQPALALGISEDLLPQYLRRALDPGKYCEYVEGNTRR
jgi:hypothetical protein